MTRISDLKLTPEGEETLKERGQAGFIGRFEIGTARVQGKTLQTVHSVTYSRIYAWHPKGVAVNAYDTTLKIMNSLPMSDEEAREALEHFKELVGRMEVDEPATASGPENYEKSSVEQIPKGG